MPTSTLFDLVNDPEEMRNLAVDVAKNGDLILSMNDKLNRLIGAGLGVDDGCYLPLSRMGEWDLRIAVE